MKKPNLRRLKWWHWLAIAGAVIVVWWLYRRHKAGQAGASSGNDAVSLAPAGVTSAAAGGSPSTGTAPTDGLSPDLVSQLGQQQSDFLTALQQTESDALAQIADLLANSGTGAHSGGGAGGGDSGGGAGGNGSPTHVKGFQWGNLWITTPQQLINYEHSHGNVHFNLSKWEKQHPAAVKAAGW